MDNLIEVTVSQKIAELTLNKPKAYNSFDLEMISELVKLSTDNGVKGIIITGKVTF